MSLPSATACSICLINSEMHSASSGVALLQMLAILEHLDLKALGPGSPDFWPSSCALAFIRATKASTEPAAVRASAWAASFADWIIIA